MPSSLRLVLAGILVAVTTAPALADYKTCMTYCMKEHGFNACHATCAGVPTAGPSPRSPGTSADKSDVRAPSRGGAGAGQCNTGREKLV